MTEGNIDRVCKSHGSLKPKIKHISRNTILSRWMVLDEDAEAKVNAILRSIEMPVLARHISEWKKIEAQRTLGSLIRTYAIALYMK